MVAGRGSSRTYAQRSVTPGLLEHGHSTPLLRMAVAALNAGQFTGGTLGLAGHGGREVQPPGNGPLSTAIVADPSGGVDLLSPAEADSARSAGGVAVAFQSYPLLLKDGCCAGGAACCRARRRRAASRCPPGDLFAPRWPAAVRAYALHGSGRCFTPAGGSHDAGNGRTDGCARLRAGRLLDGGLSRASCSSAATPASFSVGRACAACPSAWKYSRAPTNLADLLTARRTAPSALAAQEVDGSPVGPSRALLP
jgi:hypothetical protein